MDWKGIAEKIIVAVGAGILLGILGWLYATVTAPLPSPVIATARWLDVPNPAFRLDRAQTRDLDTALARVFGVNDLASFVSRLGYKATARIVVLSIRNVRDHRSKTIDVAVKDAAMFLADAGRAGSTIQHQVRIDAVDPGKSAHVYIVMPQWLYFEKPPIDVLHDGKRIVVTTTQLPQDEDNKEAIPQDVLISFLYTYPFAIGVVFLIGIVTCVIFAVGLLTQLLFSRRMKDWQAKYTTKEYVKKQMDFIDYVREHYPKNLPDAKNDEASSK